MTFLVGQRGGARVTTYAVSTVTPSTSPHEDSKIHDEPTEIAVVFTGGGARGAYQVGLLKGLARLFPNLRFPIITGVSAGAINAAYLAAHPGNLKEAADDLAEVWHGIEMQDIFRLDLRWWIKNSFKWLFRLGGGGQDIVGRTRALLDTEPLRQLLQGELGEGDSIAGIGRNLTRGHLQAVALVTVNYGTGQTVSWVQGRDIALWERPERRARQTRLHVEHVMASSALPLIFPAVQLDDGWYGDGGIRLAAPLSPALHLGADRILALSTRYDRSQQEADTPAIISYPPPAQIAGSLLNAIFLDVLDQDVERLQRLNQVVERLPEEERHGLKPIAIDVLRPSEDLGRLVTLYQDSLPKGFRRMVRGLGSDETKSPDFLSLLMFQPDYIGHLMEIGQRDAEARADDLARLFNI